MIVTIPDSTPTPGRTPTRAGSPGPAGSPYQSYVYGYPHKTAYERLTPRPALREVWAGEERGALSLYAHIPFCEVRCGFCNLFTRIGAPDGFTGAYLDALERQARTVREAIEGEAPPRFVTAALGGGTPTFLTAAELSRLCDIAEQQMGADLRAIPLSVEASPATVTADRLAVLAERGTTRLSLGVQSFVEAEARAAVRPQRRADVEAALGRIRDARIPILNIDLIYGIAGQTERSWQQSLDAALAWQPEEVYLYPLYVRPLTGLGRGGTDPDPAWDAQRLRLYRYGRDVLVGHGYEQTSMRMFRRRGAPVVGDEEYSCQRDGMVGLGCGARSYTSRLHYSFDYAVDMRTIRSIIDDYVAQPAASFGHANHGRWMDEDEARRRHLLQSLLQAGGMPLADYRQRFGTAPDAHFASELALFAAHGWLDESAGPEVLRLSAEGLAHSDVVGPVLFSPAVRAAMDAYEPR